MKPTHGGSGGENHVYAPSLWTMSSTLPCVRVSVQPSAFSQCFFYWGVACITSGVHPGQPLLQLHKPPALLSFIYFLALLFIFCHCCQCPSFGLSNAPAVPPVEPYLHCTIPPSAFFLSLIPQSPLGTTMKHLHFHPCYCFFAFLLLHSLGSTRDCACLSSVFLHLRSSLYLWWADHLLTWQCFHCFTFLLTQVNHYLVLTILNCIANPPGVCVLTFISSSSHYCCQEISRYWQKKITTNQTIINHRCIANDW